MDIFNLMYNDFKFSRDKPIKLFEAFAGIGTQHMALKNLGLDIELVGISEIDRYALESYYAIHGKVKNYGDITKIKGKDLPLIDLFTYSFPCQDLSLAGRGKGITKKTRSGLVYDVIRILEEMDNKPKVLLMENVPALLNKRHYRAWREVYQEILDLGYSNYVEVLNARDFGIPQNRDRVFMVSILGDYNYSFPKPFRLEKRLNITVLEQAYKRLEYANYVWVAVPRKTLPSHYILLNKVYRHFLKYYGIGLVGLDIGRKYNDDTHYHYEIYKHAKINRHTPYKKSLESYYNELYENRLGGAETGTTITPYLMVVEEIEMILKDLKKYYKNDKWYSINDIIRRSDLAKKHYGNVKAGIYSILNDPQYKWVEKKDEKYKYKEWFKC